MICEHVCVVVKRDVLEGYIYDTSQSLHRVGPATTLHTDATTTIDNNEIAMWAFLYLPKLTWLPTPRPCN